MTVGIWKIQTDFKKEFAKRNIKTIDLDWHKSAWHQDFRHAKCQAFVWYPHLHNEWHKLLDRAYFIEYFLNKKIFPNSRTAYIFQNKIRQKYVLNLYKIPLPLTTILTDFNEAQKFIKKTAYPFIVKGIYGFGGDTVFKVNDQKEAKNLINKAFKNGLGPNEKKGVLYIQKFIEVKKEFRVVTVGNKVIAAFEKKSNHWLKHVYRGAEVIWEVPPQIIEFTKKANQKIKTDWCGYDLVVDKNNKIIMLELNPIFGTNSISQKGINLTNHLVDYVLDNLGATERPRGHSSHEITI